MISSDKIVTTPSIQGYKITKVLGLVTGLSPRTRGVGGQIWGAVEALLGGEVTAFTLEVEKARAEAIERVIEDLRNGFSTADYYGHFSHGNCSRN
jgi:uncharacterized protein YbjQ (UPF0145 family)